MFSPVHHDLEGLAAKRFRALAGQLRRLQQGGLTGRFDALCWDEMAWTATAAGLSSYRRKDEACARPLSGPAKSFPQ